MTAKDQSPQEAPCTRCGKHAIWRFADMEKTQVEVTCSDCGRFTVPREEFETAEFEIVESTEARE